MVVSVDFRVCPSLGRPQPAAATAASASAPASSPNAGRNPDASAIAPHRRGSKRAGTHQQGADDAEPATSESLGERLDQVHAADRAEPVRTEPERDDESAENDRSRPCFPLFARDDADDEPPPRARAQQPSRGSGRIGRRGRRRRVGRR